jgi:hypothetical protein
MTVEDLVLAGAGVFPGAGTEAVVISGTRARSARRGASRTMTTPSLAK